MRRAILACAASALIAGGAGAASAETVMSKVISAEGTRVTVSVGEENGISSGQVFTLYTPGKVVRIPLTNTVTYEEGRAAAQAKAVRVNRGSAILEVTSSERGLRLHAGMDAVAVITARVPAPVPTPAPVPVAPTPEPEPVPAPSAGGGFALSPSATSAAPGDDVIVTAGGHASGVSYTWSVDAGHLSHSRSAAPRVRWVAPREAASATLTAVRRAPGGKATTAALKLRATGVEERLPGKVVLERMLGPRRFGEGISANNTVADIAFDDRGWLYILDSKTKKVYALDEFGSCPTTFPSENAGAQMLRGPSSVATVGNNLYVADAGARMVKVYRSSPGGNAKFVRTLGAGQPMDRMVDIAASPAGTVYVLDYDRRCFHVIDADGSYRLNKGRKGEGRGEFLSPVAIDCDPAGNIYVLDSARKNFQVFSKNLAYIGQARAEVAGAGEAVDLAVRPTDGAVLVLYGEPSPAVVAFDNSGGTIANSIEKKSFFPRLPLDPSRIAADATGAAVVAPKSRRRLFRYDSKGNPSGVLLDSQSAVRSMTVAPSGAFYGVVDAAPLVRVWDATGWLLGGFVDPQDETYGAASVSRVAVSGDGRYVFALDPGTFKVLSFTKYGRPVKVLAGRSAGAASGPEKLRGPRDISTAPGSMVAVLDAYGFRTVAYDPKKADVGEARFSRGAGRHELVVPWRLAVDAATGVNYVYDHQRGRLIKKYESNGGFIGLTGGAGTRPGQFSAVERMVVGARGELWVFDSSRGDVQRIDFRGKAAEGAFVLQRSQFDANIVDIGVDGCGRLYVLTERDSVYVFTQR